MKKKKKIKKKTTTKKKKKKKIISFIVYVCPKNKFIQTLLNYLKYEYLHLMDS